MDKMLGKTATTPFRLKISRTVVSHSHVSYYLQTQWVLVVKCRCYLSVELQTVPLMVVGSNPGT